MPGKQNDLIIWQNGDAEEFLHRKHKRKNVRRSALLSIRKR
jgi:hypothetical protein